MAKWIADGSISLREIPGTRIESHSTVTGMPIYNVRLEVPVGQLKNAISKLLGNPEIWPHTDTVITNIRAIAANLVQESGRYSTDGDGQLALLTVNPHLIDVTYTARPGLYTTLVGVAAYIDDVMGPRIESIPLDHRQIVWGGTANNVIIPISQQLLISPDVTPSTYIPGEQLEHTIEGWTFTTTTMSSLIGTVNNAAYTSVPLYNRTFPIGTLLLRNIQITKGMSFNSYKLAPYPWPGITTLQVKMIYEYKAQGWDKFYRLGTVSGVNVTGYYYMRHKSQPYDLVVPFPLADHTPYLP
jgi:hypothetical protein